MAKEIPCVPAPLNLEPLRFLAFLAASAVQILHAFVTCPSLAGLFLAKETLGGLVSCVLWFIKRKKFFKLSRKKRDKPGPMPRNSMPYTTLGEYRFCAHIRAYARISGISA